MSFVDQSFMASHIATLTGAPVTTDPTEPMAFVDPVKKMRIFMQVKATQGLGIDDFVRVYNDDDDKIDVTQSGERLFVMSLRAESFDPSIFAHDLLEVVRTKLFRRSSLAQLRTKNMTATSAEAVVGLPTSYDTRVISAASLDVHMAYREVEVDDTDDGVYIETYDLEYSPTA